VTEAAQNDFCTLKERREQGSRQVTVVDFPEWIQPTIEKEALLVECAANKFGGAPTGMVVGC
jgi:hypothetical protein